MNDSESRAQSKTNDEASGELRVVAINCNPAPDAHDRLRRLFTLLLEHTAGKGQTSPPAEADGSASECEDGNAG